MIGRLALFLLTAAGIALTSAAPPWSNLPTRTHTRSGTPGDPVNIAFEGSRSQLLAAFKRIGWLQADPLSTRDDVRLALDAISRHPYPTAPVSNLYLFGRVEDFAVEHELGTVSRRDHARFWDAYRADPQTHLELWIGDASRDTRIEALRKHGVPIGTTHHVDPNLDAERSLIVTSLQATGVVQQVLVEPGMGATQNGRNGGGDRFYTDGKVALVVLKG